MPTGSDSRQGPKYRKYWDGKQYRFGNSECPWPVCDCSVFKSFAKDFGRAGYCKLSHNKNKENNMTDTITVDTPTFEIRETVVNKGYIDKDGKFVQTDGDAQVAGTVQVDRDLN